MRVIVLTLTLYAPWVHSLKEKRMEIKSLIQRLRNKFNVSAAETAEQDTHQTMVISVAAIAADTAQGDSIAESIIRFVESNTQAEITNIARETL